MRYNSPAGKQPFIGGEQFTLGARCMRRVSTLFLITFLLCFLCTGLSAQTPAPKPGLLTPPQSAGCSATEPSCEEAAAKILPAVMGPSPLESNLRRLTDEVGGRVTGSPQMKKAVEWAVGAFRAAGVDVHTEKYILPVQWSDGETRLEVLGPAAFPVHLVSTGWSPATPPGGVEARLLYL